jgi:hypothetical protein
MRRRSRPPRAKFKTTKMMLLPESSQTTPSRANRAGPWSPLSPKSVARILYFTILLVLLVYIAIFNTTEVNVASQLGLRTPSTVTASTAASSTATSSMDTVNTAFPEQPAPSKPEAQPEAPQAQSANNNEERTSPIIYNDDLLVQFGDSVYIPGDWDGAPIVMEESKLVFFTIAKVSRYCRLYTHAALALFSHSFVP